MALLYFIVLYGTRGESLVMVALLYCTVLYCTVLYCARACACVCDCRGHGCKLYRLFLLWWGSMPDLQVQPCTPHPPNPLCLLPGCLPPAPTPQLVLVPYTLGLSPAPPPSRGDPHPVLLPVHGPLYSPPYTCAAACTLALVLTPLCLCCCLRLYLCCCLCTRPCAHSPVPVLVLCMAPRAHPPVLVLLPVPTPAPVLRLCRIPLCSKPLARSRC